MVRVPKCATKSVVAKGYVPLLKASEFAGVYSADVNVDEECAERVAFTVRYSGDLCGAEAVLESYELTPDGLTITPQVEGGQLVEFVVPLLVTDGMAHAQTQRLENGFQVTYDDAIYEAIVDDMDGLELVLATRHLPNSNGIYRLGRFVGPVAGRAFRLSISSLS